jgi:uncharacterized iron-regulated membrane protein
MTNLKLRRAWFQVHKWIGLSLAILIIPLSLSGAALVFQDSVDRALNPARYATSGADLLAPGRYADAARAALEHGERIASVQFPTGEGPIIVAASKAGGGRHAGPPARTMVYLDPPSARVLDVAASNAGAMRVIHMLHGSLLLPGVGRTIVGWIGVAMMVSCFTGLWLWWPTVGRWARGLRWRRHRNLDTNLHHLMGFWVALPLFVLSLSGAWIAFPAFFGALTGAPAHDGDRGARFRARPIERPAMALDVVVQAAQARASGTIREIDWPTDADPSWKVTLSSAGSCARDISIADAGGTATVSPTRAHGGAGLAGVIRRLHDGDDMGPVWRTIIFIAGILPALLAITGIVMWWRARNWREAVAERLRGDRPAAE